MKHPQTLYHLPLESYRERYTEMLSDWEIAAFSTRFQVESIVPPEAVGGTITQGRVLDTEARSLWSLRQVATLVRRHNQCPAPIWLSDFFTPGIEALFYQNRPVEVSAFCWAQTFDGYDFTRPMAGWMRPWEDMLLSRIRYVFVAHEELADRIASVYPHYVGKIKVVGLPFSSADIRDRANLADLPPSEFDVVYSSRWDTEKQPDFFLRMVVECPDLKFAVCTGSPELRGDSFAAIAQARALEKAGRLSVFTGLSRSQYYGVLQRSHVQFNCALQDWVSFTLLEALTFGCIPVYPNYRSFPQTLNYSECNLYPPFLLKDAIERVRYALTLPRGVSPSLPYSTIVNYHDGTLGRIRNILAVGGDR